MGDDSQRVFAALRNRPRVTNQYQNPGMGPGVLLGLAFAVCLALIMGLGLSAGSSLRSAERLEDQYLRSEQLAGRIAYYDELLTQSARLAATTGDLRWVIRYEAATAELDQVISDTRELGSQGVFPLAGLERVEDSRRFLVEADWKALELVRAGLTEEATAVLFAFDYEASKAAYASGLAELREDMRNAVESGIARERSDAHVALALGILALAVSLAIFGWAWMALRRWYDRVESLELQKEAAAAELADGRLRTLTESSTDVALVADADKILSFVGPAAATVLGRDSESLLGESLWTIVHHEDHADLDSLFAEAISAGGNPVATHLRIGNGDNGWLEMAVSARDRIDDSRINGVILNAHDVTELVDAQRRAQELLSIEVRQTEHLRYQAEHDALTDLFNRTAFQARLSDALVDDKGEVCLLKIDLDGFKDINDARGHQAGDRILVHVANRLRSALRQQDVLARIGGDEFAILLRPTDGMSVEVFSERMLLAIATPIEDETGLVQLTASIGIAGPDFDVRNTESAMTDADLAMHQAKRRGRNQFARYRSQMRVDFIARVVLKEELERALVEDEFVVHYQPVWDLGTGHVVSVEALVRWQHPSRGLLAPAHFLPMAEQLGLIGEIDAAVFRKATCQLGRWRSSSHPALANMHLGVNVSALDLSRSSLADLVSSELAANNLPASALVIEITETAMMDNVEVAKTCLSTLHDMGVKLAIDDFGTGYSSLSQLQTLDFDILKIDRAFVAADDDAAFSLLETIVTLAQMLDLRIVAEGIETSDQLLKMQLLGSQFGQGFLMAKPMPAAEIVELACSTYSGRVEAFKVHATA